MRNGEEIMEGNAKKPNGYWTKKENCELAAKECATITEFQQKYGGAYNVARENGWIDEWFERQIKPNGFWTKKENCELAAKECATITEFQRKYRGAYKVSSRNGWIDEWFERQIKPHGYWTKERCAEASKECRTRNEFQRKCGSAYQIAWENGWLDEFTWLEPPENVHQDGFSVYVYEFEDKSAYVGVTCQKNGGRDRQHRNCDDSAVHSHAEESGLPIPKPRILKRNLSARDAQLNEAYYIKWYGAHGWNMLNVAKAGSLGSVARKWTKERIMQAAKQCKTRIEFQRKYRGAYHAAERLDILEEVYSQCGIEPNHNAPKTVYAWDAGYGDYVGKYESINDAARELDCHQSQVSSAIAGRWSFANGYIFTTTDERPQKLFDRWKKVFQLDDDGNIVKTWRNTAELIREGFTHVHRALRTGCKCKGSRFRYATREELADLEGKKERILQTA